MSLDFDVIKDLLIADQQLGNISFSQFASQIRKFQDEFFGQQATFISDFKRIKTFLSEQKRLPHNSPIIQNVAVYLSYTLCLMFFIISCTVVVRKVVSYRSAIHTTVMDVLCWPIDKMCPSRSRQRRAEDPILRPSKRRNQDAIASVEQQLIELNKRQKQTDLKIEKTTGIANTAKRDVVALLSKNDS